MLGRVGAPGSPLLGAGAKRTRAGRAGGTQQKAVGGRECVGPVQRVPSEVGNRVAPDRRTLRKFPHHTVGRSRARAGFGPGSIWARARRFRTSKVRGVFADYAVGQAPGAGRTITSGIGD